MRYTKIICTLGPAVDSDEKVKELILGGMNCARFNFSHGTHEEQKERLARLRRIREELNRPVAILMDTKGPEIRVGVFEEGFVELTEGQTFTLDDRLEVPGDRTRAGITYAPLAENLSEGKKILIDDGKIGMVVEVIEGHRIICRVTNGGRVSNRKSINVPGAAIDMPYISEADREDLLFAIQEKADYLACSFVRSAGDVLAVRRLLRENAGEKIRIISKIENMQGYRNLDEILDVSDGIMVARGDLGVEVPFEEVPAIQKRILTRCAVEGKISVTATQMLDSMMSSPRPTRAEVSDVANAIYDGTTVIMLSGETAAGKYPTEAVKTMARIAEYTEGKLEREKILTKSRAFSENRIIDGVCLAAEQLAEYLGVKVIITTSLSGRTAFHLANYWPPCPVLALVFDEQGKNQLALAHGVCPRKAVKQESIEALLDYAKSEAVKTGLVEPGDRVAIVIGSGTSSSSVADTIRVCEL